MQMRLRIKQSATNKTDASEAQSGQSLVEFALILPIFLIILLGVINVGLAIRAQLQLAQVAQQAAQYLVYNPAYASSNSPALLAYMNSLSSYQIAPIDVTVTVGTSKTNSSSCSVSNTCVLQDTVTIRYPFPLIFPMVGKLSVGMLHSGAINLGANESTVAAAELVGTSSSSPNPCVAIKAKNKNGGSNSCPDIGSNKLTVPDGTGEVELLWAPPPTATRLNVPLSYCIERIVGTKQDLFYADPTSGFSPVNNLFCVASKPSSVVDGTTPERFFLDDNGGAGYANTSGIKYSVLAIQLNGLASKGLGINIP
jgi:Flp pilus assembly protein TadG